MDEVDAPFDDTDLCFCEHAHNRHDMGHGCIECRCRGFREAHMTPDLAHCTGCAADRLAGESA